MAKFEFTITGTFECHDSRGADELSEKLTKASEDLGVTVEDSDYDEVDYDLPETQIVEMFEEEILPDLIVKYGRDDEIAIRTAFNDYTDMLCKEGQITTWQYENIDNPY